MNAGITAQFGAMWTETSIAQLFHANEAFEDLGYGLYKPKKTPSIISAFTDDKGKKIKLQITSTELSSRLILALLLLLEWW